MKRTVVGLIAVRWALGLGLSPVFADNTASNCYGLPTTHQLQTLLVAAPNVGGDAGGLFHGVRMWGAVVNREGEVCAFATSTADPTQVWPGSQAIAKAKAYTYCISSFDPDYIP